MNTPLRVRLAALPVFAAAALVGMALHADPPRPPPAFLRGQTLPTSPELSARSAVVRDPALDEGPDAARLAAVASRYLAWGRVDDELRWAPWLCRLPNPSVPRLSHAEGGPHARKVYFLYARDRDAYLAGRAVPGQVVVKEAWSHRPVTTATATQVHGVPIATTVDGHLVEPDQPQGLYVMTYVGPQRRDSDQGWIYGTLDASGAVTSSGRIESCMGCHREATHGRLFGITPHR